MNVMNNVTSDIEQTNKKMETYIQIKARHQADINAFPIGAAFSKQQLADMLKKFDLPNNETGYAKIVSLGAGCFIRKSDIPAWREMTDRHKREMEEFRSSRDRLISALRIEFTNRECQFMDDDEGVCAAVGLDWKEVQKNKELLKTYNKAFNLFMRDCEKADRY